MFDVTQLPINADRLVKLVLIRVKDSNHIATQYTYVFSTRYVFSLCRVLILDFKHRDDITDVVYKPRKSGVDSCRFGAPVRQEKERKIPTGYSNL